MTAKKRLSAESRAIRDGYLQIIDDLRSDLPNAAAEFDKQPPALFESATPAQGVSPPTVAGSPEPSSPSRKGVTFSLLGFAGKDYQRGLRQALTNMELDPGTGIKFDVQNPRHWALLGVKDLREFAETTQRAFTQDPTHAVTPEIGVGNFFEIVGWNLPETKFLVETTFYLHRDEVHAAAAVKGALRDGLNEPVDLKSRFSSQLLTMENTHILFVDGAREVHGGKSVDRLPYQTNDHDQTLAVFGELKGITASSELTPQLTKLHGRLLNAMRRKDAQAFLVGTVNGVKTRLPLAQFVFLADPKKAGMGRVGVRAAPVDDPRWDVRVHNDSQGNPYTRLAVVCRTTFVRRVYIQLFRELGL